MRASALDWIVSTALRRRSRSWSSGSVLGGAKATGAGGGCRGPALALRWRRHCSSIIAAAIALADGARWHRARSAAAAAAATKGGRPSLRQNMVRPAGDATMGNMAAFFSRRRSPRSLSSRQTQENAGPAGTVMNKGPPVLLFLFAWSI